MTSITKAALLGLVQGLTEFLPISSSGHLVLTGELFQLAEESFAFDAVIHLATLLAVVVYFRREIKELLSFRKASKQKRLLINLGIATLPAILAGFLFYQSLVSFFEKPLLVAGLMMITALVLILFERLGKPKFTLGQLGASRSLGIGLAQSLALLPGVSRLGLTLSAGLFYGLKREETARFSFLLSLPIILAAGLLALGQAGRSGFVFDLPLLVGFLVAFAVALLAIAFLMRYIKRYSLVPFAIYLLLVGGGFLVYRFFFV